MNWWLLHLNQFIETKAKSGGVPQQKMSMFQYLVMCPWASITNWQWLDMLFKSTYCLLRHGIPLFMKVIEVLGYRVTSQLIPLVFYGNHVWRKCRPLHFRYPSFHQPFPNDATLMSWSIGVHEDEISCCSWAYGYGLFNVLILKCTAMTRHAYPHCNTTTTKGLSGDNSGWCIAHRGCIACIGDRHFSSAWMYFHQWIALRPTGPSSTVNAPWPMQDDDACAWWCDQDPCRSSSRQTRPM